MNNGSWVDFSKSVCYSMIYTNFLLIMTIPSCAIFLLVMGKVCVQNLSKFYQNQMKYRLRTLISVPDVVPFWHHLARGKAAKNDSAAATCILHQCKGFPMATGFRSSIGHLMNSIDTGAASSQGG